MKNILMTASALALCATAATAGGIERSTQSVGILFEEGNYAEFSIGQFNPSVSGVGPNATLTGLTQSGDMAGNYGFATIGVKFGINEKLDVAVIVEESVGANVAYPAGTGYRLQGSTAKISNTTLSALARYKLPSNFSMIGGVRLMQSEGRATLAGGAYNLTTSVETDAGYVVGVAWEKPEIAARVALTYNSKITHTFAPTENGVATNPFDTTIPESVNLEFQTGIAQNTLLFGSVRWVHWTQFDISPQDYLTSTAINPTGAPLVEYKHNTTSYSLGVGRKFNEKWSGAAIFGYEKTDGRSVGNLGPTDGYRSVALAASYQASEAVKITGAVRYVDIGNATTNLPVSGNFSGNSGWGAGLRVGISF